jgi:hypothetical protein
MSPRPPANTRGQRPQWHVGLAAWTLERSRRTAAIGGLDCSVSSCRLHESWSPGLSSLRPACGCMACLRHQRASAVLGLLAELPELTLRIVVPIRLGAAFPRGRLLLYPVLEHCGALMGCGGRGFGWPQCAAHAAREGAESARTLPQTRRRHASGATGPLWAPSTARREPCAAPHPVVRPAPYPGGTRCVRRPFPPLEAHCGEDGVDRQGLEARHVGQSHTGAPVQRSAESTRGLGALRWSMGCRWGREGAFRCRLFLRKPASRSSVLESGPSFC